MVLQKTRRAVLAAGAGIALASAAPAQPPPGPAGAESAPAAPLADSPLAASLRRIEELRGNWSAEWEFATSAERPPAPGSARGAALQMAQSEDPETRRRAIEALGTGGARVGLTDVLWGLGDPDPGVRELAVAKVSGLSPAALLQQVLDVLVGNDEAAVRALDAALPDLAPALGDEFLRMFRDSGLTVPLRRAAAYSLGRMRAAGARDDLVEGAWEKEATLAMSCALALYNLRDTQTVRDWVALRKHPDADIRWLALVALGELGGREAFAALVEVAYGVGEYEDKLVKLAIEALGAWPLTDCVPALIEVMKRNPGYRRAAAQKLRERTGQAIGDSAAEWEYWYLNGPAPLPEAGAPPTEQGQTELLRSVEFVPPEMRGQDF